MARKNNRQPPGGTRPGEPGQDAGSAGTAGRESFADLFALKDRESATFAGLVDAGLAVAHVPDLLAEKEAAPERRAGGKPRGKSTPPRPQEQIDLHGCTGDEAETRTEHFLNRALGLRLRTVLIITGKGLHSPQGAVLKDVVEARLRLWKKEKRILDYAWERKRREESGALIVRLP